METPSNSSGSPENNNEETRGTWAKHVEFTLSCIGYSVGFGNLWRFPYVCMRNGGGAFLIPYLIFLVLCGIPVFFLELCIGQFSSLSPLSVWRMCPLFKGIGWSMMIVTCIITVYYNVIIAWILYYLGWGFRSSLPWASCDNAWNTDNCTLTDWADDSGSMNTTNTNRTAMFENGAFKISQLNGSGVQNKMSAAEEFWSLKVLDLSDGIHSLGSIKWDLCLCLMAAWLIAFLCLVKGIKSSGKVVYVTATMPYLLLGVLLIRGVTLRGSWAGIRFYVTPDWNKLTQFKVWTEACLQIFYSLGPGWGVMITLASYNRFHNNCLRDALVISCSCAATSFFAGFVIFSVLGSMAYSTGQDIEDVITQGPGLLFIVYPEAISKLPLSPLWSFLFFLTLLTVGMDSQFCTLETVTSCFIDEFPHLLKKKRFLFLTLVSISMMLVGLVFVTRGGMYVFQIVDWYSASFSLMVIALSECLVVSYVYGIGRFYHDITLMLRKRPSLLWAVCWCGITPTILVGMLIVSALRMNPVTYGSYEFPPWAIVTGWILAMSSIVSLPIAAVYMTVNATGSLKQRLSKLVLPATEWGPLNEKDCINYKYLFMDKTWKQRMDIVGTGREIDSYNLDTKCEASLNDMNIS